MTAQELFTLHISDWGERESYLVTEEEFSVFLKEEVEVAKLNHPNGDGTYSHSLLFGGKRFLCVSHQQFGGVN